MEQTRRNRKKDNTHRALMHSAKLLFEKNGLGNVTIDQIAEGADVSRSTFFSHFTSLDDLLGQIAGEEIDDIIASAGGDGAPGIGNIFEQLAKDTYPYPYLMSELFMRSIFSPGQSPAARVDDIIRSEIESGGYSALREQFDSKDISAFIFGAYFGLIFQKLMHDEPFENPSETNDKIQRFIKYLNKQEENDHE